MKTPGNMTTGSTLKATSDEPTAKVIMTFNVLTKNQIPSEGAFVIEYPDTLKAGNELKECTVSFGAQKYRRSCSINQDTSVVIMKGGLPGTIPAGTNMTIVLGEFTNPRGVELRSLVLRTYYDN
jgi:hypothetical protein